MCCLVLFCLDMYVSHVFLSLIVYWTDLECLFFVTDLT